MPNQGAPTSVEELRGLEVFKDLPDWQIAWFCENAEIVEFEAGELAANVGDPADAMTVMLSGNISWESQVGGQWIPFGSPM